MKRIWEDKRVPVLKNVCDLIWWKIDRAYPCSPLTKQEKPQMYSTLMQLGYHVPSAKVYSGAYELPK